MAGRTPAQLSGDWTLEITDFRTTTGNPLPPRSLDAWSLKFSSGLAGNATDTIVATSTILGSSGRGGAATSAAIPQGIGVAPVIAIDNTLGSFSPYQGRLYVGYTNRSTVDGNPADNTDVFLTTSVNAGANWSTAIQLNRDNALVDGYSEGGVSAKAGRAQFQPQLAVDPTTGTLVAQWDDGRHDAARARVATYMTTSIDGGATLGEEMFANEALQPTDLITNDTARFGDNVQAGLGPIPDNQSATNRPAADAAYSFGDRQGLAVYGGRIYSAWSSNLNGGFGDGKDELDIRLARATIAAGPRVIAGTMGPVGSAGDTINNTRAADGSPQATSFVVTFDRRVDPATFVYQTGQVPATLYSFNFESGLAGFTFDNKGPDGVTGTSDDGLWKLSTGRGGNTGHSPTHSLYYGQGETAAGGGNYDTGFRNSGLVTSPVLALPSAAGSDLELSFSYFLVTENLRGFDVPTVTVIDATTGTRTQVLTRGSNGLVETPGATAFRTVRADLTSFAGRDVRLEFSFDTVDSILNDFEGWYVDDVTVRSVPTPPDVQLLARDVNGVPLATQPTIVSITPLNANALGATQFRVTFTAVSTPGTISYAVGPDISDRIRVADLAGNLISRGNAMDQDTDAIKRESREDLFEAPKRSSPLQTPLTGPFVRDTLGLVVPGPQLISSHIPGTAVTSDNLALNQTVSQIDVTFDRDMAPGLFTAADMLRIMGPAGDITQAQRFASTGGAVPITDSGTAVSSLVIDHLQPFTIKDLNLRLDIAHTRLSDLRIELVYQPPAQGTPVKAVLADFGQMSGQNMTGTTLSDDDDASRTLLQGTGPYTGIFKPSQEMLSKFDGLNLEGTWRLEVTDNTAGETGQILRWSLEATPEVNITVTPTSARTFRITFPTQELSGTYTIELGSDIRSATGNYRRST